MTPDQQRIAIAEWLFGGSRWTIKKRGLYYRPNAKGYTANKADAWIVDEVTAKKHEYPHDEPVTIHPATPPDYAESIAARRAVWEKMDAEQRGCYVAWLSVATEFEPSRRELVEFDHWMECVLKAIEKWEEPS